MDGLENTRFTAAPGKFRGNYVTINCHTVALEIAIDKKLLRLAQGASRRAGRTGKLKVRNVSEADDLVLLNSRASPSKNS
jgi:hypothetical protein